MNPPDDRKAVRSGLLELGVHVLLWAIPFVLLLIATPPLVRAAQNFAMKLPEPAVLTIEMARWLNNYWYAAVLFFVPLLALDGFLLIFLRLNESRKPWRWGWSIVAFLVPAALNVFVLLGFFSLYSALADVLSELGRV